MKPSNFYDNEIWIKSINSFDDDEKIELYDVIKTYKMLVKNKIYINSEYRTKNKLKEGISIPIKKSNPLNLDRVEICGWVSLSIHDFQKEILKQHGFDIPDRGIVTFNKETVGRIYFTDLSLDKGFVIKNIDLINNLIDLLNIGYWYVN